MLVKGTDSREFWLHIFFMGERQDDISITVLEEFLCVPNFHSANTVKFKENPIIAFSF